MNYIFSFIILLLIGYVSGNIHGAYIVGKIFRNEDIRNHGSKNSGTTNALRVFGFKIALMAFIIDFSKAFFPVYFASDLLNFVSGQSTSLVAIEVLHAVVAIGVILGHNYPAVLKFKGGKGIASTVGILFAIDYRCGLIFCGLMILIVALTRYVSLASIISSMTVPVMLYIVSKGNTCYLVLGLLLMVLAVYRHKENIKRLKSGTESKFLQKAGK